MHITTSQRPVQFRVPMLLRPLRGVAKMLIRSTVYVRLRYFPLHMHEAEWWAEIFKKWPAIFGHSPFEKCVQIWPGITLRLGIIDVVQRTLLVESKWEQTILEALRLYLRAGDTFLDVGANIGYFTLVGSYLVGEKGKVFAFEPSIRVLDQLIAHTRMNQCSNVTIVPAGISDSGGLAQLNWSSPGNLGASTMRETVDAIGSETMIVMTLDEIAEALALVPNLIKIDIEGAELMALKGMRAILDKHGPIVICELVENFLADFGNSVREVFDWMERLGYAGYILEARDCLTGIPISSRANSIPSGQLDVLFTKQLPFFPVQGRS